MSAIAPFREFYRTTTMGVRDFQGMGRSVAGPEPSQVTTATRVSRATCGKESPVSTPCIMKKSFYINILSHGGANRIRILNMPKHHPTQPLEIIRQF
jgi:hypothetical protein